MAKDPEQEGATSLDVTQGVIWRQLLALGFPVFLSSFFQQTYSLANAWVVGRFAGTEAFAAIQSTTVLTDLVVGFTVGLGMGCGVVVSQYFGAHDDERLSVAANTAMGMALVFGIFCSVAGVLAVEPLLRLMGTPADILGEALTFVRLYMAAMVSSVVFNMGSALQRAVGDTKTPSAIVALSCVVNICLDLLLVAVLRLGTLGCGIATASSLTFGAVVTLWHLERTTGVWRVNLRHPRIEGHMALLMVKMGLPLAIQSASYSFSNIVVQSSINSFGSTAVAGWGLAGRIDAVVWLVSDALGSSVTTFAAQNFGARNYARMGRGLRESLAITAVVIGGISAVIVGFARPLAAFFVPDARVVEATHTMLLYIGPFYVCYSLMDNVAGTIRGAGESLRPMLITLLGTCALRIAWLLALVPSHHTLGTVLVSYPITWILTGILFVVYYKLGHWRAHAEEHEAERLGA